MKRRLGQLQEGLELGVYLSSSAGNKSVTLNSKRLDETGEHRMALPPESWWEKVLEQCVALWAD